MNNLGKAVIILFVITLTACAGSNPASPTNTPVNVAAIQTSTYSTIVAGAHLTETAQAPTNTPKPTSTPLPTETPTPEPQPIILKGAGDSVVDIQKLTDLYILKASHTGSRNFAVINYAGDKYLDLLVNTIGNYSGTMLLTNQTTRFEIKADGNWELQILPFGTNVRIMREPGTITGTGDDVIALKEMNADLLKASYTGNSNFAITVWTINNKKSLAVNTIGAYTGTSVLPDGAMLLEIIARDGGAWSIEITSK